MDNAAVKKMKLYEFDDDPACIRVKAYMDKLKLDYSKFEVPKDATGGMMMIKHFGLYQVPILVDLEGRAIIGEDDIIDYIKRKFGHRTNSI